jgi:REP element-mobilizing transposase RayT
MRDINMARALRIEYAGAWYHVMNQGVGRQNVFDDTKDFETYLEVLGSACQMFEIEVHAFSLMDNHYHLLIHTPKGNLGRAMRHVNGVYTQKYNRAHGRDGGLFRGRYKAILVDADEYLQELVRYIHLNPVKAGKCRYSEGHKWTSHVYYKGNRPAPEWLKMEAVLSYFGRGKKESQYRLDEFVRAGISEEETKELEKSHGAVLGGEVFRHWIEETFMAGKDAIEIPQNLKQPCREEKAKHYKGIICKVYDMNDESLKVGVRGQENEGRRVYQFLLREGLGYSLNDIAKEMRQRDYRAVAKAVSRVRHQMKKDEKFASRVEKLKKSQVKT